MRNKEVIQQIDSNLKKWRFPNGKKLTPRGSNDSGINSFLDNIIDSLTREVIQNSLDAKDKESDKAVEVSFDFSKIETNSIPGINQLREFALPRALEFWEQKGNSGTLKYLGNFQKTINQNEIQVLKISDYNTCGLNEKSYDALVIGNGYSEKDNENSAGSKGIGKAAPFAISDLRLVFYSTVPKNFESKHVGVLNFVSFNYDEKNEDIITQERALYQSEKLDYIPGQINFGFDNRTETQVGTDIFILALRSINEDWEKKILLSAVNNFLVSILEQKLIVKVNDSTLNHENIKMVLDMLSEFQKSREEERIFDSTLNYFDALTNNEKCEFYLDESFLKYPFIDSVEDGKLILLKREKANRSILQTRISGMKIYDRRNISGNIQFTGVFRATGTNLDKFLKELENTNHSGWSENQAPNENWKHAKSLLKELFDWFKKSVKESFEESTENIVDAFGTSKFLPLISQRKGKDDIAEDSGIINKFQKVEIKTFQKPTNLVKSSDNQDEKLLKLIDDVGFGNDEEPDGYINKGTSRKKREKASLVDKLKFGNIIKNEILSSVDNDFRIKNVVLDSKTGKYRFILKPQKNMKLVELRISYVGEDGNNIIANIKAGKSETNKIKINNSVVRIENVKKNKLILLDLVVDSEFLVKMEGNIYEIKK